MTPDERHQRLLTLRQYAAHRGYAYRQAKADVLYQGVSYSQENNPLELLLIKVRNHPKDAHPTLKVSKNEIDALLLIARQYNLRAVLVVNWEGNINWLDLTDISEGTHPDEALFPEATIGNQGKEERVYCVDNLLFRVLGITHEQLVATAV